MSTTACWCDSVCVCVCVSAAGKQNCIEIGQSHTHTQTQSTECSALSSAIKAPLYLCVCAITALITLPRGGNPPFLYLTRNPLLNSKNLELRAIKKKTSFLLACIHVKLTQSQCRSLDSLFFVQFQ